ncbi:MAG: hypothetical protein WDZ91_14880 [Paenibacillaceae bacterium]
MRLLPNRGNWVDQMEKIMNLEQAYVQYRSQLFGLSYRMLGSINDAEDIEQDVFMQLSNVNMTSARYRILPSI